MIPLLIALVNGGSPFFIAMFIISPLWLNQYGVVLPLGPWEISIAVAFRIIFLLGAFLGKISGTFWLWTGLRTLAITVITSLLILLVVGAEKEPTPSAVSSPSPEAPTTTSPLRDEQVAVPRGTP
ncbi:hypothetical protein [Nitrosococcus wardiae]|uniref:hypothetical protein n=1 Tax=Nitrosococcus wardiae TaxID=1814290 RepID=UPI00197F099E|nr:hypothetical protein [Nitrosococcus wardiae]